MTFLSICVNILMVFAAWLLLYAYYKVNVYMMAEILAKYTHFECAEIK